jgi:hypothetical protein
MGMHQLGLGQLVIKGIGGIDSIGPGFNRGYILGDDGLVQVFVGLFKRKWGQLKASGILSAHMTVETARSKVMELIFGADR